MSIRKSLTAIGIITALGAPVTALADGFWVTTNDEAGSRIVQPALGTAVASSVTVAPNPPRVFEVSGDRQYVFLGEEGGWELRPMQYEIRNARFAHVDDPAGHMQRVADSGPLTVQERETQARLGGS